MVKDKVITSTIILQSFLELMASVTKVMRLNFGKEMGKLFLLTDNMMVY